MIASTTIPKSETRNEEPPRKGWGSLEIREETNKENQGKLDKTPKLLTCARLTHNKPIHQPLSKETSNKENDAKRSMNETGVTGIREGTAIAPGKSDNTDTPTNNAVGNREKDKEDTGSTLMSLAATNGHQTTKPPGADGPANRPTRE